jgi:hypothetical protein
VASAPGELAGAWSGNDGRRLRRDPAARALTVATGFGVGAVATGFGVGAVWGPAPLGRSGGGAVVGRGRRAVGGGTTEARRDRLGAAKDGADPAARVATGAAAGGWPLLCAPGPVPDGSVAWDGGTCWDPCVCRRARGAGAIGLGTTPGGSAKELGVRAPGRGLVSGPGCRGPPTAVVASAGAGALGSVGPAGSVVGSAGADSVLTLAAVAAPAPVGSRNGGIAPHGTVGSSGGSGYTWP